MAQRAPRYCTTYPPTKSRAFTAAQVLDNITGLPPYAALRLDLICGATPAITLTHEDGTAIVVAGLTAGQVIRVDAPIRATTAVTNVTVIAHWWGSPGLLGIDPQNQIFPNP